MREAQWPFAPLDKGKPLALAMGWLTLAYMEKTISIERNIATDDINIIFNLEKMLLYFRIKLPSLYGRVNIILKNIVNI